MRNPGGYACVSEPDRPLREADTFTCAHCNRVVHVPAKANPDELGGFCRMCMSMVCPQCANGSCTPFEKKLAEIEARYHARRSYEKV